MAIDRRQFAFALGASMALGTRSAAHALEDPPVYLTAAKSEKGFAAVLLDDEAVIRWTLELPGRGHGAAFRPSSDECIIFARRPGDFALVLNRLNGQPVQTLHPPEDRHFYGHGCYSSNGRLLYTTENDFESARGVIGLWDASDGYRRLGEYDSHGIGPHEILLMPDGRTLAVANGGIATHPDTGRLKLNIPEMEPSLVLLNSRDGTIEHKHTPPRELHKLSLRHLSANRNMNLFAAAQFEGPHEATPPLLASVGSGGLTLHHAPKHIQPAMKNYCGSVAFNRRGDLLAVSCPRGNLITYWTSAGDYVSSLTLQDGCGLAPLENIGGFLATAGTGEMIRSTPDSAKLIARKTKGNMSWDNHLTAL